jgi:hypothetical protein
MGVGPATFNSGGQSSQHYIPGVYSRPNYIVNEGGGVSSGNVVILGYSELGKPNELLVFSSANDARAELLSGEGLTGVVEAFRPGGDIVPQQIGFMRVNPGTQSQRALQKSAVDVFVVKSSSYGVPMNQVRLKFSAGTTAGTHKIETEYKGNTETFDDIERKSIEIQYTGAGTPATLTIDATKLTTAITGAAADNLDITLADYQTVSELAQFINNQTAYTATVVADEILDSPSELDMVTAIDILTAPVTLKSDYQAVFEALELSAYIGEVTKSGANRQVPDYDAALVYLTGAVSGAYTVTEFLASLAALETADVQLVGTSSTDAAVHSLIKDHCVSMSSVEGRKERQFLVGGAAGETVAQVVTRAKNLNVDLGQVCTPGYYDFNDAGKRVLYAPSYYACKLLGLTSASAVNEPSTNKTVGHLGWEKAYKNPELETLIKGGVTAGGKDESENNITVRAVTAYQGTALQRNESSMKRIQFFQDRDLRKRIERATIGTPLIGEKKLAVVDTVFERAILDWKASGLIVANGSSLYSGYTRRIVGDQILIEYNTWNTSPTNFVFIAHNISVLSQ